MSSIPAESVSFYARQNGSRPPVFEANRLGMGHAGPMTEYTTRKCTQCGNPNLDDGFVEDSGQNTRGFARWIAGPLELGPFGGAKRLGRRRHPILAFRCTECGHLELFVDRQ